jgi:hypothetical protein
LKVELPKISKFKTISFLTIHATDRESRVQCLALHLPEGSQLHPDDLNRTELLIYLQAQYIAAQRIQPAPKVRDTLKKEVRVLLDGHESIFAQKRLNTLNKQPLKASKRDPNIARRP